MSDRLEEIKGRLREGLYTSRSDEPHPAEDVKWLIAEVKRLRAGRALDIVSAWESGHKEGLREAQEDDGECALCGRPEAGCICDDGPSRYLEVTPDGRH